jgi:succinyl-diaminopimelate desuccinylase
MPSSIELTQELVRFNTINPPGAERPCAERLANLLEGAGFAVELIPFGEGRAQILARLGGTETKLPLGFTGHIDTVPLGAQPWSVDPFAADIAEGKLYGRGSSDMKSGVAAFVAACIAHADRLANTSGVLLVITAGEETGCTGADALVSEYRQLGKVGALVVAEPTGNKPLIGHKGLTPSTRQRVPFRHCRSSTSTWRATMCSAAQRSMSVRSTAGSTSTRFPIGPRSASTSVPFPLKVTRKSASR